MSAALLNKLTAEPSAEHVSAIKRTHPNMCSNRIKSVCRIKKQLCCFLLSSGHLKWKVRRYRGCFLSWAANSNPLLFAPNLCSLLLEQVALIITHRNMPLQGLGLHMCVRVCKCVHQWVRRCILMRLCH